MNVESLGFVGLGKMGAPMASRLAGAGYSVVGFDAAGTGERLPAGAHAGTSVENVASRADVIFLSLPHGAASSLVCSELASVVNRRVHTVADLSTIGIAAARECAGILNSAGMAYVDAPVSGGVAGARSGSLAMMVGASAVSFEFLRPLFGVLAKNCFRVGDAPGHGQAMKLVNNFISATALAATSEAVLFGTQMGLDMGQMIEVVNASSGRTTASADKFPRSVIPGTYDFGFAGAMMDKDVALYFETARASGMPHEIGEVVAGLWRRFSEACPGTDFTYIYKYLEDQSRR